MGQLVWLVSYPKSGNTWLRLLMSHLVRGERGPVGINELGIPNAAGRELFERTLGFGSSDLTPDEVTRLRPEVYRRLAQQAEDAVYLKLHDAYQPLPDGASPLGRGTSRVVIYLVRNPLDLALSLAHHDGCSAAAAVTLLADASLGVCCRSDGLLRQLPQRLLSWSQHVQSWLTAPEPVILVRYEDLLLQPRRTLAGLARCAGLVVTDELVRQALERCQFRRLQQQERDEPFRERSSRAPCFFRRGQSGAWRDELAPELVQQVLREHGQVMRQLGYLDGDGAVLEPPRPLP